MFVYKKLKASDAGITAFEAHKEYTSGDLYYGRYNSASKDTYSQFNLNNELEYFQLDHLFYKDPIFRIGNLNGGINYIDQEKRLYDKALIISIPQSKFGSAIQKGTVNIDSTYVDDSKGNLYKSSETISDYPQDKERVLYVGPVKGFKRTDLTRDLKTGELLVNPSSTYSDTQIDDSLYANPIIYNGSSLEHFSDINCTAIQLSDGNVKIPHSSNFNFNNDDFTISFYYKSDNTTDKIIIDKSTSQPTVLAATNTSLGSQTTEEKVNSIPYEITVGSDVTFKRTDIDGVTSQVAAGSISTNTLYHIACVKTGSDLKVYVNGSQAGTGTDNTNICRNKSDVLIGRTEDTEARVSQLMIWNRGLSTTEIANVSESIDGSPYVGNVFYENGIVTFTSPKYNDGFASISTSNTTLTLNATEWVEGDTTTQNVIFPTFNGEFTFFNLEEDWFTYDYTSGISNFIALKLAQSTTPPPIIQYPIANKIRLYNPPYQSYENIEFNPLTSSQDDTYTTYSELSSITTGIPGISGTSSGELGTDSNSSSSIYNPQSIGSAVGIYLVENLTVTESINVLFVSNSQETINEDFNEYGSATTIDDTIFSINDAVYTGVKYKSLFLDPGFYIYTDTPVGFESYPWWSGSMSMPASQIITDELESDPIEFSGGTISYTVPEGVIQGATYDDENPIYTNSPGTITIDAEPENGFSYTDPLKLQLTITGSLGFDPNFGDSLTTKIRFYANGSLVATETVNGFASLSTDGYTETFNFPDHPIEGWVPEIGEDIYITLQFQYNGQSFPVATSGYIVTHFGIYQDPEQSPYVNYLESRTNFDTKLSSVYHITCSKIAPNGINPNTDTGYDSTWVNNSNNGLNTDVSGNTLGIKTLLWNQINGTGNYTLITQSFYPSSSYSDTLTNNFYYAYETDPENDEELFFQIVADTAENEIPDSATISSLNNLTSWDYPIAKLPDSASMGISGSFIVTEISASNILHLDTALSDKFTSSLNLTSSVLFGDLSTQLSGYNQETASITGFVSDDGTQIILDRDYFSTSSFYATASLDIGNYISGSSSIDISEDEYGIYFIDNLDIRTSGWGDGIISLNSDQKVKITTKVDGTVLDTRYVTAPTTTTNAFESGELELGVLNSSNNVSFEYTIVSGSSNELDTVVKDQGFSINEINIRRITSSNTLTLPNNETFSDTQITYGAVGTIDYFALFSPHANAGDANLPFTNPTDDNDEGVYTFGNLATPNSLIQTDTSAELDEYFFITESITVAIPRDVGPFDVSHTNFITTLTPGKEYDITWTGTVETEGDSVANEGAGIRIIDISNNNILKEVFVDSGTNNLASTNVLDFTDYRVTQNTNLKIQTFISGASSGLYPDGIVSSSITASFSNLAITIDAKSGSYFSTETITPSDFTVISGSEDWIYNWTGEGVIGDYTASQTNPTNILHITSSHLTYTGNTPSLNTGEFTVAGVQLNGSKLEVGTPLFITASSVISGTAPSTIEVLDSVVPVVVNPFTIDEAPTEGLLGYTFEYTNPVDSEVEILTITAINEDNNTITVNNGQGLYQVGTYDDPSSQEITVATSSISFTGGSVNFKNTHLIFENEFQCTVEEDEFNFTLNPTARKYKSIERGELANFATGSNFKPYVTTIGLYNDEGELLVVGKLAQPVRMSDETDTTFVVRFDT